MFRYLLKKLHRIQLQNTNNTVFKNESILSQENITYDLSDNVNKLKNILGSSGDIIYRDFSFGSDTKIDAVLIYLDGLTEKSVINDIIIKPLMYDSKLFGIDEQLKNIDISFIKNRLISVGEVKLVSPLNELIDNCLSGNAILLIQGCKEAIVIHSKGWKARSIEEPKTEAVVRGPREGFSEDMSVNISMLRRKIRNPNLTLESFTIGTQTKTNICIAYIKGITNPKLITEVKNRLNKIKIDAILESGFIEQLIEDAPLSIFPTVGNSEKPDSTAAKMLEGRLAIFIDGSPFSLTVPMLFIEGFQSSEDYYSRSTFSSIIRLLRYLCFLINILAPATYVMLATFHQELIPTALLFTMASGREGVPFPAVVEASFMIITFEILREAGVRLPRPVGQAVSIVGALVIGEAAVSAGLVSALMVIVVALTAVSSFVVPVYTDVAAILRFIMLIAAGTLGIFGVTIILLTILIHLCSLRSFGTPYLSPLAPLTASDLKDTFIRAPIWSLLTRPRTIGWHNLTRQNSGQKPIPPKDENENKE